MDGWSDAGSVPPAPRRLAWALLGLGVAVLAVVSMARRSGAVVRGTSPGDGRAGPADPGPRPQGRTGGRGGVYVSALDLFTIGIGPSSSHTVGPMRAAADFASRVRAAPGPVTRIQVTLYGSLAATGPGHGTPGAIVAGLEGAAPQTCDPGDVRAALDRARARGHLELGPDLRVPFSAADIDYQPQRRLPRHANALRFRAVGPAPFECTYYSVGGGFIEGADGPAAQPAEIAGSFTSAADLLRRCDRDGLSIAEVARRAERARHADARLDEGLGRVLAAMRASVEAGLAADGVLPGPTNVSRRARPLAEALRRAEAGGADTSMQWLQAYALAVTEENAAGGRVVTAPTNGASGIVPAVLLYAQRTVPGWSDRHARDFLLTAAAIGSLVKGEASISGAEGGCQAEVGAAAAMAAAGLCATLGGTVHQVENAAEIAIEHHLGLTCDPVAGLVQIPCIERNAIAACTAVAAARLATYGDGRHVVSLDTVLETMRQTGADMSTKYKETSAGGLAVNVVEC